MGNEKHVRAETLHSNFQEYETTEHVACDIKNHRNSWLKVRSHRDPILSATHTMYASPVGRWSFCQPVVFIELVILNSVSKDKRLDGYSTIKHAHVLNSNPINITRRVHGVGEVRAGPMVETL